MGGTKWIKIWLIKNITKDTVYFSLSFELQRNIRHSPKFFGVGVCVCVCVCVCSLTKEWDGVKGRMW